MKTKPILLLASMVVMGLATAAPAADKLTALTYGISVPGPEMDDYIGETSFIGVELAARKYLYDRPIMVGFSAGWQVFDEKTTDLISTGTVDVWGTQRRYMNAFPLMLTGHYYMGRQDATQLYAGLGAGVFYMLQRFDIGVYSFEEGSWQFGLVPEVGVQYPMQGSDACLLVNIKYNYAFEGGESLSGEGVAWDYLGINVGFAWTRW